MAKWHYTIESNQRIKEYNHKNGKHDYLIRDVVKMEENGNGRFEKEYYGQGKPSVFVNIVLSLALLISFSLYIIFLLLDQFEPIKNQSNISLIRANFFNIFGVVLAIVNTNPVLTKINFVMRLGEPGNKLYLMLIVFFVLFHSFVFLI